jgi:anaerobic selenocysteine-containing dehydrogenase
MRADYRRIRHGIQRVVPGFADYEERVTRPGGFVLPHPPRDSRTFTTPSGKAHFSVSPVEVLEVPPGHLVLQTLRSHDQFNTTIYGLSDRYRGIEGGRQVVMVHPRDIEALGLRADQLVDIVAHWPGDDRDRRVRGFRVVDYDTPRGTAAAYYPETNPLVPLGSAALESNTPTSKSVIVRLEPVQHGPR